MARALRSKIPGHSAGYHVVTRTHGRDFLLNADMKANFVPLLNYLKRLYYVKIGAFAVMSNHYHLLVRFADPEDVDPGEAMQRWNEYHADTLYMRNPSLEAMDRDTPCRATG